MKPMNLLAKLFLAFTLFVISFSASAQQKDSLVRVTNQLYVISGLGGNVSFLTTPNGVLLVDAGSNPGDASVIMKHIQSVTDKPVKYIIITHYHYDHSGGLCGFPNNTTIIGHKNLIHNLNTFGEGHLAWQKKQLSEKQTLLKLKVDSLESVKSAELTTARLEYEKVSDQLNAIKNETIVYPVITFDKELNIYLGTDTVQIVYPGATHTDCSIAVKFINQEVLVTGDMLFNHAVPYIDFDANANTQNWATQLSLLSTGKERAVVPGHGAIGTVNDLKNAADFLTALRSSVKQSIDAGKTLEQTEAELKLEQFGNLNFPFFFPKAVESIYKELTLKK
jgi:cyclase